MQVISSCVGNWDMVDLQGGSRIQCTDFVQRSNVVPGAIVCDIVWLLCCNCCLFCYVEDIRVHFLLCT